MPVFSRSEEAHKLAVQLVKTHYPELKLHRIDCLFQDTVIKKGGDAKAATIEVVKADSPLGFYATGEDDEPQDFLLIKISKPIWDRLTKGQKKYVIDHELSHAWIGDNGKLTVRGAHDVEENYVILRRWPLNTMHGVYEMAKIVMERIKRGDNLDIPPAVQLSFADMLAPAGSGDGDDDDVLSHDVIGGD